jgi:hypothetical protein
MKFKVYSELEYQVLMPSTFIFNYPIDFIVNIIYFAIHYTQCLVSYAT